MNIQSVKSYSVKKINTDNVRNSTVRLSTRPKQNLNKNVYFGMMGCGCNFGKIDVSYVEKWSSKLLRISKRTESEMNDLAEYFHKYSDSEIKNITNQAHCWSSKNARNAADRLIEYVTPIRKKKLEMVKRISELEIKKAIGISNEAEQKIRLNREFISLILAEKEGKEPPIKNGILVHGTSKNKEGFINWLTESAGAVVKTIQHDSKNPIKTIDSIVNISESSERAFKYSNTRTILIVKDLDKLIKKPQNREDMTLANAFKGFIEDISEKYHTTVITKTDKSLDEFEPATIASNRLGVHVDLKDGIKEDELKELNSLKVEVERLDKKASHVCDYFKKTKPSIL